MLSSFASTNLTARAIAAVNVSSTSESSRSALALMPCNTSDPFASMTIANGDIGAGLGSLVGAALGNGDGALVGAGEVLGAGVGVDVGSGIVSGSPDSWRKKR